MQRQNRSTAATTRNLPRLKMPLPRTRLVTAMLAMLVLSPRVGWAANGVTVLGTQGFTRSVSADGRVVVGDAFVWTAATGMASLGGLHGATYFFAHGSVQTAA